MEIINEVEKDSGDKKIIQQDIKLLGLEGDFKNKEVLYRGISEIEVVGGHTHSPGDRVLVVATRASENDSFSYYITDYVRSDNLILIAIIFLACLLLVGRMKGLRSILYHVMSYISQMFLNQTYKDNVSLHEENLLNTMMQNLCIPSTLILNT